MQVLLEFVVSADRAALEVAVSHDEQKARYQQLEVVLRPSSAVLQHQVTPTSRPNSKTHKQVCIKLINLN